MTTRTTTLTRTPAILMNVAILFAAALLLNRSSLPHGWLPEYRGADNSHELFAAVAGSVGVGGQHAADSQERIRLIGKDTLFVGDSITRRTPEETADVISLPGATTEQISNRFASLIEDQRYDRIILWPGNAHFHHGGTVKDYVHSLDEMVTQAKAHANEVVVVTPVPWRKVPRVRQAELLNQMVPSTTWWATQSAKNALASNHANVQVFDGSAFRSKNIVNGSFARFYEDRFHLNTKGTLALFDAIDEMSEDAMVQGPTKRIPAIIGAVTGA